MAQVIAIAKEHDAGLYDSATGEDCITEKVVDITEDCPGLPSGERSLFLYTRDKRGRIVQINRPYPGEEYMGCRCHFSVDQLENEMNVRPRDDTFGTWATALGLSKSALCSLIRAHAPLA